MEYETEINVQIKWGALQHWAAQQTTLHREVEECNREHELDLASHNEKTDVYWSSILLGFILAKFILFFS